MEIKLEGIFLVQNLIPVLLKALWSCLHLILTSIPGDRSPKMEVVSRDTLHLVFTVQASPVTICDQMGCQCSAVDSVD